MPGSGRRLPQAGRMSCSAGRSSGCPTDSGRACLTRRNVVRSLPRGRSTGAQTRVATRGAGDKLSFPAGDRPQWQPMRPRRAMACRRGGLGVASRSGRPRSARPRVREFAAGAMLSAELRQAECGLISGAAAMPADSADLRPAWPEAPVRSAADALYDARRGVYYTKPVLRGWLHLVWFEISVVIGTLLLARAHGATRITAAAIYAASVSALFGVSALYHRGNWARTTQPPPRPCGRP